MASVLVVGGGIGGLCAARALVAAGHAVTLVEQRTRLDQAGAGLVLPAGTLQALGRIGVDVAPSALALQELRITSRAGAVLARAPGRTSVLRTDLHRALADGVAGILDLRLGCRLSDLSADRAGATACFGPTRRRFDLVVGADGIRSAVRAAVAPRVRVRSAGQTCWRGVVRLESGGIATESWNGRWRLGTVPLRGGLTYGYLVLSESPGTSSPRFRPRDLPTDDPRERSLLQLMADLPAEDLLHHDLVDLSRPAWGAGAVALIGDAAHAMTPNLGAGAAAAIEDALTLAAATTGDLATAVGRAAHRRAGGVRRLNRGARLVGRAAHLRSPAARGARDALMRLALGAAG